MTHKEIQNSLKGLYDEKPANFAIKKCKEGQDIYIDANRNGIIAFCILLLESIDKSRLERDDTYDFPDSFWDESDISLSVQIQEGNKNKQEVKESFLAKTGCILALIVSAVVLIVGIVTSFKWLVDILK